MSQASAACRQQLEQLAGALFMAVEGGREDECREALEFLSKFSCQERAVVIPRAKHLELIWQAGVEIGSVQMLRMLCEFFQAAQASSKFTFRWETHNFAKNAKKPRTVWPGHPWSSFLVLCRLPTDFAFDGCCCHSRSLEQP